MPLFFDIEMKTMDLSDAISLFDRDWESVLKLHLANLDGEVPLSTEQIGKIVNAYKKVVTWNFSNEECRAGLGQITKFIIDFLKCNLDIDCSFYITSGCREKKLSFHLVTKDLIVDSSVKSMPLLVFEIARAFQTENLRNVVSDFDYNDSAIYESPRTCTPIMTFQIRAIMLFELVVFNDDDMDTYSETKDFTFRVVDDTLFDESVYSTNHLLRAPGACKTNTSALHPVTVESQSMFSNERIFSNVFPPILQGLPVGKNI
jgi:hypothetical protein